MDVRKCFFTDRVDSSVSSALNYSIRRKPPLDTDTFSYSETLL